MMDSTPAHHLKFEGLYGGVEKPTEERLYEIELARLASRQVRELIPSRDFVKDERAKQIFLDLERELMNYKGTPLPSPLGPNYVVVVKPSIKTD